MRARQPVRRSGWPVRARRRPPAGPRRPPPRSRTRTGSPIGRAASGRPRPQARRYPPSVCLDPPPGAEVRYLDASLRSRRTARRSWVRTSRSRTGSAARSRTGSVARSPTGMPSRRPAVPRVALRWGAAHGGRRATPIGPQCQASRPPHAAGWWPRGGRNPRGQPPALAWAATVSRTGWRSLVGAGSSGRHLSGRAWYPAAAGPRRAPADRRHLVAAGMPPHSLDASRAACRSQS